MALALRLAGLDAHGLWYDEALEVGRAAGGWRTGLWRIVLLGRPIDQDPPLLAVFLRFWTVWGDSEWWLRVPSALAGAAAVAVLGAWAARRFGSAVGATTAWVLAVAPVQIHYGQEVNQYAALVLLTVVGWVAWEGVVGRRRSMDWRRFTAVSVLGLLLHYGLVFPWAAMSAWLAVDVRRRGTARDRRALAGHAAACGATIAVLFAGGLADRIAVPHLQGRFGGTHLAKELDYLIDVVWRQVLVFFTLPFSGGGALVVVGAMAVIGAVGAVALWRDGSSHRRAAGRRAVAVVGLGALAAAYPADGLGWYPLGYRWGLYAAPAFALMLAAGLVRLGRRAPGLAAISTAGVAINALLFAPQADAWNPWLSVPREGVREAVAVLAERWRPGDVVFVNAAAAPISDYYGFRSHGSGHGDKDADPRIGVRNDDRPTEGPGDVMRALQIADELDLNAAGVQDMARTASAVAGCEDPSSPTPPKTLWLVVARAAERDEMLGLRAIESARWHLAERLDVPGAALIRFECDG